MGKSIEKIKYQIEIKEERILEIANEISDLNNGYIDPELSVKSDISMLVMERNRLQREVYDLEDELEDAYEARDEREF